ncbi:MAG: ribosome biogenesis GTPase Der [Spirochaetes bacterium]|nr:ribosome biogenesis GTPase Der [Spirochaetota bacterium]
MGKPNVGKSSVFNRLLGRRKAIVFDEPGVTIDVNYGTVLHEDLTYTIADSTGFVNNKELSVRINRKLIEEAQLVIFTCDTNGPTGEDYEIAGLIRKSGKPYLLLVNKADNEKLERTAIEFYELGLTGAPLAVSAEHGRNIQKLYEAIGRELVKIGCGDETKKQGGLPFQKESGITVAIVGKPNVGKSSLLNLIVQHERSLVAPEPGTTRDTVEEMVAFSGTTLTLIDTAGIRKKKKNLKSVEFFSIVRAEAAIKQSSVAVLLIDATSGITTGDKKIASVVAREKKGLVIAANKWDIAKKQGVKLREFVETVYYNFPHIRYADVIPVSAKTGYNKTTLLNAIITVYRNYTRSIRTSELNDLLKEYTHHGLGIKYGYQKAVSPPIFEFFVNKSVKQSDNFNRFMTNAIRKSFPFSGVPIEVILRK